MVWKFLNSKKIVVFLCVSLIPLLEILIFESQNRNHSRDYERYKCGVWMEKSQ